MEILGYAAALLIGISLGLIGGGGSILAVPILAYLFGFDEKMATAYSLFVVGSAALVGSFRQNKNANVDWKTALVFGIPAIIGAWNIRHFIIPLMPEIMFTIGDIEVTRRMVMFGFFAILMLLASYSMLSDRKILERKGETKYNYPIIIVQGILVGAVTGFVGAGGGFLIIPALVTLANLEIKKAIGTSLMIIAINSLTVFFLSDALTMSIDWMFLLSFTGIAVAGIFIGAYIGQFIDGKKLKKGFGYFIIVMAIYVFIMEFFIK